MFYRLIVVNCHHTAKEHTAHERRVTVAAGEGLLGVIERKSGDALVGEVTWTRVERVNPPI
jgi:hypothetical protein